MMAVFTGIPAAFPATILLLWEPCEAEMARIGKLSDSNAISRPARALKTLAMHLLFLHMYSAHCYGGGTAGL